MKMRVAKVLESKSYTADDVAVINLVLREPISALFIEAKATNSSSTPTAHPAKSISKVEILDGSRVIHSLTGYEIQARQFYGLGKMPENILNYISGSQCVATFLIPFGRYLGDTKYALDLARLSQPQLRITVDVGAGGSVSSAVSIDVDAYTFDEAAINPAGFLCAKEYFRYSLVSSGIQEIDLPRDRKIKSLLLHSLSANKEPYEQYAAFKLTEDNDRRVPFDLRTSHYMKLLGAMYGKVSEHLTGIVDTTGVVFYVTPSYEVVMPNSGQGAAPLYSAVAAMNGGAITLDGSAAGILQGIVSGLAPHGTIVLPFGDPNDDEYWYDLSKVGSLKLKITAGSAVGSSSEAAVVLETVEPY